MNENELGFKSLLSIDSDAKTIKGEAFGYITAICYLAPADLAGPTVCKFSTPECRFLCLNTAGRGIMESVQRVRIARTKFWHNHQADFLAQLESEIRAFLKKANRVGRIPAIRLNGTSDLLWENFGIIGKFSEIQFYDYTKYPSALRTNLPANYHLTYSYSGTPISKTFSDQWFERGVNSAVVFRPTLPAEFFGRPVLNGDESDLRFLDKPGCIVGLKAKGKARKGVSSFVQIVEPALENQSAFEHARETVRVCNAAAAEAIA